MGERLRSFDWAATPLGPIAHWPDALRIAVDQMMASRFPACLFWGPDLVAVYNDGYRPILGRKPEALGQPMRVTWPEVWDVIRPIAEKALAGESTYLENLELEIVREGQPEQAWFTFCYSPVFDAQGRVAGMLDVVVETTDAVLAGRRAKALAQAAVAERDVLARIVEATEAEVQVIDTDWRILAINRSCADEYERMFGVRPRVGHRLTDILARIADPAERDEALALWSRALAGESFTMQRAWGPGEDRRAFQMRFEVLRAPDGTPTGAFLTGIDVTERVRSEEALAQAQDALRQAQKMEAVGQLTGGLAHDFNNLLAAIGGSLQVLKAKLARGESDGLARYVEMGERSVQRAAALTHRLLAFSRRQTLDPQPTDVNRLVRGMEELVRRTVGPAVALEVDAADGLWPTRIDAPQLENSLLNLCINARDAMLPDGGRLTIATTNLRLVGTAARELRLPEGDYVCIAVTDTGAGIAKEDLARIFDPFYTTKPLGQGTGLGLSMVYGFVNQSGGQVQVESEPGRGTTMRLVLPRSLLPPGRRSQEPAVAAPVRGDGQTVLLVEDEATLRELLAEALGEAGYRVLAAADGAQALKLLQGPQRVDLLLTDVGLPGGLNGRQVADAGRSLRPGLQVLFVTGYAEKAALGEGLLEPGMQVLAKPFELAELARRVKAMVEGG
jgi:signal transduction histidine kinase/ActR/RegA family two-component response regulator